MSLRFNTYRAKRYLRSRFVEGKYLLASEASDLQLESLQVLRKAIEKSLGSAYAVEDAWKVELLTTTQILIRPGQAWVKGLPIEMRSGGDQLVSGAILTIGIVPVGVSVSDEPNGLGKILTFNDGATTPTNNYRLVVSAQEELITDVDDPFLKNVNLTESTAQKVRLNYKLNLVPVSLQSTSSVPYRDENSTSLVATNFPNAGGFAAPNLASEVVITPQAALNGELISTTLITGSEGIDGRDVELVIRNDTALGGGIVLPNSPIGQQAFANSTLIDSSGNMYHVNAIFNDTISTQLVIRIDKEVDQANPQITNGSPFTLIKKDVFVTDDINGSPQGKLYWDVAEINWDSTNELVHPSVITDLREFQSPAQVYQETLNQKTDIRLTNGGDITWSSTTSFLTWSANFTLINPHGLPQTILASSQPLVEGGSFHYNLNLAGGALELGQLAVNVTAFGLTSTLSAAALGQIKIGNIIVDSAGTVAEITDVDDVNNTITTSIALTANGAATVYLDSYGPSKAPLKEDSYILAVRYNNKVYVDGTEFEPGETGQLGDGGISLQNLNYIGATSETDDSPAYSSNNFVTDGDSLTVAIGDLDGQLGLVSNNSNQDRTNKLIKGGTWSWDLATNTLTLSSAAYVQIAGLADTVNTVAAQSIVLAADAEVAYIDLKRVAGASTRTVSVSLINLLTLGDDTKIIARRVGNDILIGESFLLKDGEFLELDGALAEVNRLLGLLRIKEHETATNKVRISGAENSLLDSAKLNQIISDFLLDFDGAVINFTTGAVLQSDDSTPLGNNFTPFSIPSGQYFWYGISILPDTVNADNTQVGIIQVDAATAANASASLAPKPNLSGDIKLGAVQVFNNSGTIEIVQVVRLGVGSGSGSGTGSIKANYLDPISTSLPSGVSVTIDGISGVDDDLVLFTNLSSGNNRIYKLGGVGVALTWTPVRAFKSSFDPIDGDSVRIMAGNAFQEQLAVFDGTDFKVNDVVRFFDGVSADYWELGSIKTAAIANNTTANVFTVTALSSENFNIPYSVVRGSAKRSGQLLITTDGTDVAIVDTAAYLGEIGVEFTAYISTGDLVLDYISDNSGATGTLKFFTKRWSDASGGPTGVPSYSGGGGGGNAAGSNTDVQFNNSGALAGDSNFQWDSASKAVVLNGAEHTALSGSLTINDNQLSNLTIISYDKTTYPYVILEYSISRGTDTRVGRLLISNNGTLIGFSDDFVETTSLGVTISAAISGSNVDIQYISTSTGNTGTLKYFTRRWN